MKKYVLLTCGLLLFIGQIAEAQFEETSININSQGTIDYEMPSLAIKHYASPPFFMNLTAEEIARNFDMGQAVWQTGGKVQQVHELKPDFAALLYRNVAAIYNYSEQWQMALDNNWILKEENGNLVFSIIYPANYAADIGSSSYQVWVASWIKQQIEQYGFDGVMADIGLSAFAAEHFWSSSATVVNPRTGLPWTDEEVRRALLQLHREIKKAIGSKLLVVNGIFNGTRFWRGYGAYTEILSNSPLDGFISEGLWYRYSGVWMSEQGWLDSLNFLVYVQENFLQGNPGRLYVGVSKLDTPLPLGSSKEQMAEYAFASTLLGVKTNQTCLAFREDVNYIVEIIQPLFDIDVGAPSNDYYVIAKTRVYARDFANIKVLVNPTSDLYQIDLGETLEAPTGELVSLIAVEPHTGIILKRVL